MRIISGTHKGRPIKVYRKFSDRPTTDMAKEGLINVLKSMYFLEEFTVLDLFAGSGSISYEFVSNGVTEITCVDSNAKYIEYIKTQSQDLFPEVDFNCLTTDVFEFVKKFPLNFDIIFADPPYDLEGIETLPDIIFENKDIPNDALIIIEHGKETDFRNNKFIFKEKKYSRVHFSFFKRSE